MVRLEIYIRKYEHRSCFIWFICHPHFFTSFPPILVREFIVLSLIWKIQLNGTNVELWFFFSNANCIILNGKSGRGPFFRVGTLSIRLEYTQPDCIVHIPCLYMPYKSNKNQLKWKNFQWLRWNGSAHTTHTLSTETIRTYSLVSAHCRHTLAKNSFETLVELHCSLDFLTITIVY